MNLYKLYYLYFNYVGQMHIKGELSNDIWKEGFSKTTVRICLHYPVIM